MVRAWARVPLVLRAILRSIVKSIVNTSNNSLYDKYTNAQQSQERSNKVKLPEKKITNSFVACFLIAHEAM